MVGTKLFLADGKDLLRQWDGFRILARPLKRGIAPALRALRPADFILPSQVCVQEFVLIQL
jgi:hypothetical protein